MCKSSVDRSGITYLYSYDWFELRKVDINELTFRAIKLKLLNMQMRLNKLLILQRIRISSATRLELANR